MKQNIFVTGAGGCVGHYLFDILSKKPEYNLYLLIRNPKKVMFNYSSLSNVHIIEDDFTNIKKHASLIKEMDILIHILADWGGVEGNYNYTLDLFNCLDINRCKKVIYFSTASILGPNNELSLETGQCGTPYIRGKFIMHKELKELPFYDRTITLFPTWVLGGDKNHPISHASAAISSVSKYLWLLRFSNVDASFHFIHAQDIASITNYLLESNINKGEYVLGNESVTADFIIKEVCRFYNKKIYFQIPISADFVKKVASLFGKKLSPWDIYCLDNRHQVFKTVNAKTFGLASNNSTIEEILKNSTVFFDRN